MPQRIALVTGGTGGIGTSICRELKTHGFIVVAGYNSGGNHDKAKAWQEEQREDGYELDIAYGDVSDAESSKQCIDGIVKRYGNIHCLVNNAGITRDSTFRKMTLEQWDQVMNANLRSVFNITRLVINGMLEEKWGRVINISSVNGQKGQFGQANYAAAKAGMHGFTKSLAQEVGSRGVTVNTISPGSIMTAMVSAIGDDILEQIASTIPVGRLGNPDEIAYAVSFLASTRAGFITGSNLAINGGQHMF
ncbi:acetoacetyl-CoA reductase [Litorivicinus sp.]|nr:acetoacetyl-CoA reductase [Litorivicinus sp.]MDC1239925.1 acetoacetyl-CoA reductase [Litorivicinus sp.]